MSNSRRQRIAFVITELEVGGAEKCLANLAVSLDPTRFQPTVIALAKPPPNDLLVRKLEARNVPVHFLNLLHWRQSWAGLQRLTFFLREQKPKIVQTFLFHANVLGAMAAARANIANVFAGARVAEPRWIRLAIERWALARSAAIICVSDAVADHYERHGFPREKLKTIPNGIDVDAWRDAPAARLDSFQTAPERRIILFVGRLDRQKGVDVLLKAMPAVFAELPDVDLFLVGDGPERSSLTHLASTAKALRGRVHFTGWQDNIAQIMKASQVVVLPSRWEGMPNVVLEAMAAGLPVVASQTHGVRELLGTNADEQSCPPGDARELSSKLVAILQDRELRGRLGHANQQRAAEEFSLASMVRRYEELYSACDAG
jgi:glycosyltransferase involved in cell wall biosynthesis